MTDTTREAVARAICRTREVCPTCNGDCGDHWKNFLEEADAAIAAIAALRPAQDAEAWRDIASAPKDGTRILVDFGPCGVHAVAWEEWASGIEIWCVDDCKHGPYALRGYVEKDLRGWMPLPASPPRTLEGK